MSVFEDQQSNTKNVCLPSIQNADEIITIKEIRKIGRTDLSSNPKKYILVR